MSTWSGIRNKLENDYLCPTLRGHIQYFAASYWESHDQTGRAAIRLDGVEVLRSNYYAYEQNYWNRYQALRREGIGQDDRTAPFRLAHEGTLNDGCFDNGFFYEAFHEFDNQSIEKSLVSKNPLVRILALLDRRLGKRRLLALEESMEQELDWVRAFYVIRLQAEGLMEENNRRQELSNGDCSGAVYMAIWDWCESELDLDVRFPAPQTENTLDCALLEGELASELLATLREQSLPELAAEIAADWELPTEAVQSGLETLRSHLELVQSDAALLYEMT